MDFLYGWIEQTALSVWVRESPSYLAFPLILILHTVGMGFLAGGNVAMDLRVLGFAPGVSLTALEKVVPVLWLAFFINAVSGVLLLAAYPTKALTNPVFYVKLLLIAIALTQTQWIRRHVLRDPHLRENAVRMRAKLMAGTSIAFWAGAIFAGRFLAYTYTRLMVGE